MSFGTALSATQLNATANVGGSFSYTPVAGTVLGVGTHTLSVTFNPANTTSFTTASTTVMLTVNKAVPAITWATPAAINYGTVLSATQLDATSPVAGNFVYDPPAGTGLTPGSQTLSVTFTPTSTADYATATDSVQLTVNKDPQTISFTQPVSPVAFPVSPITLSATGGASGNPVTFSLVSGPGTLSGTNNDVLTVTGPGTIVVAANQAGNTLYATATQVTCSVVVTEPLATLVSPAPGSTLGTSDVQFTWTAGTGATEYQLWLGLSGPGSSSLYTSGWLTASTTSTTVASLPEKGATVYARLFSMIGGKAEYNDYTYTESVAGVPATMSTPAQGSTLGTSNVQFTWTAGTGVTQYQLWLGLSGPGSSGLYASGGLTAPITSTTVTSLPANGATVYARLYSTIAGKNQYNDYTYTESVSGVPATMSTPAQGSTLGTSNVQFTWTAGTGVTQYQLWLGLSGPGSSSLYASGWLAAPTTSTTVASLPAKGATVYARLYSMIGGKNQYNDYTYVEQ